MIFFPSKLHLSILKSSIKASLSPKTALVTDCTLVLLNNLSFIALWKIFFLKFHPIGSWDFEEMSALIALSTGSYGLMLILFGGVRRIAHLIVSRNLDTFFIAPGVVFWKVVFSISLARGWGHLITSFALILMNPLIPLTKIPLILLCIFLASLLFTAITCLLYTVCFWIKTAEHLTHRYYELLLFFSMYPTHVCHGALKLVLFSLCPASIAGVVPIELLTMFDWSDFLLFTCLSLLSFYIAINVFQIGLERYRKTILLYIPHNTNNP